MHIAKQCEQAGETETAESMEIKIKQLEEEHRNALPPTQRLIELDQSVSDQSKACEKS